MTGSTSRPHPHPAVQPAPIPTVSPSQGEPTLRPALPFPLSESDLNAVADAAWKREFGADRFEMYLHAMARQLGIIPTVPFALETRIGAVAALWRSGRGPFAGKDDQGQWDAAKEMLQKWARQNKQLVMTGGAS